MKKLKGYSHILILFASVLFIAGNVHAQRVTNGSFEASAPGIVTDLAAGVDGWLLQLMDGADASFEVVDNEAQSGNQSLKIVLNTAGTNQWSVQAVADSLPVTPGVTYTYSVWAKAEKSGLQVNFTIGNYAYSEYKAIRPATLTTEWQEFTCEFTVSDDQTVIRAPIHFNYAANANNAIYIDNLVIQSEEDNLALLKPALLEAEDGVLGSGMQVLQADTVEYVTVINNGAGLCPGSADRLITFEVTFPDTGVYDLFARLRVGANGYDDDSFFCPRDFGEMDPTVDSMWVRVNGLAGAGFSEATDVVDEIGTLGKEVWKWVNVSKVNELGYDKTYTVGESLTQTFQIGGREDGLDIDKIAFGKSYIKFTVENLDKGEAGSSSTVEPEPAWEGPPLASKQPKFVGNVYSSAQVTNFVAYWNQVTPENAGKWGSAEPTRDVMNWTELDASYKLAKDNGFPFHFHCLLWGSQQPSWISNLEPAEQLEEIREWFEVVAARYPAIDYLEVVNEPLLGHNPPDGTSGRANYKAALGGDGETGWDWVINAFRMAREIFPADTRLMLNDFGIISSAGSTNTYLQIITLLQAEDLIDIIAEQGHAFTTTAPTITMKTNLDALAATGLPIQITELDIDGTSDAVQLQGYQRIFPALYEHPGVEGITLWGWRRGLWRDTQGAYLLNSDGTERPALVWLRDYLDSVNVEVSVEKIEETVSRFDLSNNYPNPFNPSTTIQYSLPHASHVRLEVFDIMGRSVQVLFNGEQTTGEYAVKFDASHLASGVYFYRLDAGSFKDVKQMMLIK